MKNDYNLLLNEIVSKIFIFALLAIIGYNCSDKSDELVNNYIQLSMSKYDISAKGGIIHISPSTNADYDVKPLGTYDWIEKITTETINSTKYSFQVKPNEDLEKSREAKFLFYCLNDPLCNDTLTINQQNKYALVLSEDSLHLSSEWTYLDFKLITNINYKVSTTVDWITYKGTKAVDTLNISFYIAQNTDSLDRTGEIQITGTEMDLEQTIVIKQAGTKDKETIEREALIAFYKATDGDNWKNNTNWCSDKPLGEWFGVTMKDGYVYDIQIIQNNIRGNLPPEIGNLEHLMRLNLKDNLISGTIPEELGKLKELKHLHLDHNWLEGDIPDFFNNFPLLMVLDLSANKLTGKIPESIYNCIELETLLLYDNKLTGTLSEKIEKLQKLDMLQVHQNQLEGKIPEALGNLQVLRSLHLRSNNFTENLPSTLVLMEKLKYFSASANRLSGDVPTEIMNSPLWNTVINEKELVIQQEGYKISLPNAYVSTDFSKNGHIYVLQQHSVGKGIRILFAGEGFSDRLIDDGTYEKIMKQAMENFFEIEPFKTYRDRFDVYVYVAVSENELIGLNTVFGTSAYDDMVSINYGPLTKALEESSIIDLKNNPVITCAVILNITSEVFPYRVNASWALDGFGTCNILSNQFDGTLWHEMNGHAFASLADEYTEDNVTISEEEKEHIKTGHLKYHNLMNIDVTSNPDSVIWASFIKDERYKSEKIGVFEGTRESLLGTYRATEMSIMKGISNSINFNAPSRQEIFRRIMERSGEEYSLDKFLEYDEINRKYYDSRSCSQSFYNNKMNKAKIKTASPTIYRSYNDMLK